MPTRPRLTVALQALDYPPDTFISSVGLYTKALAGALAQRGHRVHVLSRGGTSGGASEGADPGENGAITVHRLSASPSLYLENISPAAILKLTTAAAAEWRYRRRLAAKLNELVETEGVDLIEVADAALEAVLYRPQAFPRVPFIVRLHGPMVALDRFDGHIPGPARPVIRWAEGRLFHKATHLTTPSRSAERLFRKEMGLGGKRITVYPNMPTFDLSSVPAPAEEDPDLVLYVGRHLPIKGVHLLVRAIPGVLEKRPHTRFVFVGPDGPTNQAYASSQRYLLSLLPSRYRHAIQFTGYQPLEDVADFYARAAVCVIPSLFESFGYTCLEAMAHSKAIVATPTGDMATMLDHGRCGLIYTPGASDNASGDLSAHILRLLNDPELRRCLGKAARERALVCYHPDLITTQAENFYYRAIAEQRERHGATVTAR